MTQTQEAVKKETAVYSLHGTLIEACSCGVSCPCWIGEDPDLGECFAIVAYHMDDGRIQDIDVSGLSLVFATHIPGNVLAGNWEVVALVDNQATTAQKMRCLPPSQRSLEVHLPMSISFHVPVSLNGVPALVLPRHPLIGTVKGVEDVPISHQVIDGAGTLNIPGIIEADMEPYRGPDGSVTTLHNSIFSTVPGSPAWVAKATRHRVNLPQYRGDDASVQPSPHPTIQPSGCRTTPPDAIQAGVSGRLRGVWSAFGAAAMVGDLQLHHLVEHWTWLAERPQVIAGQC